MHLKSTKKIAQDTVLSYDLCIKVLMQEGLVLMDKNKLLFTEQYNNSTHTSNNRMRPFFPILQGKLVIDNQNSVLIWRLKIDGILFKTFLLFAFSFSLLKFLLELEVLFSIIFSGFVAIALCMANIFILDNRINSISEKMASHLTSVKT